MVTILEDFRSIRTQLTTDISQSVSIVNISANHLANAEILWDTIEAYFETNNLSHLDRLFHKWMISHPDFAIEATDVGLGQFFGQVIQFTLTTINSTFNIEKSLRIINALIPLLIHGMQKITAIEVQNANTIYKKHMEETRNRIEQFERNKSKFTTIAAHELKTPLTIVDGYVYMLNERVDQRQAENVEILTGIKSGLARLKEIVKDLVDVSLIDNRMLELSLQPVWLNRLFAELQEDYNSVLEARSLDLRVIAFEGMDEMFISDPERLIQIFNNILQNAIKFTPDNGQITLTGRRLSEFLEVSISDTGIGIDLENQSLIFDKYHQLGKAELHSSGKTKFKGGGPGLGLHITKGLIEALGGTIWVESPGYDEENYPGSTFHVLIPLEQNASMKQIEILQNKFQQKEL